MTQLTLRMLLVDAVIGSGKPFAIVQKYEKTPLLDYTGNQWNTAWEWNREALGELTEEALQALYVEIKEHAHAR